MKLRVRHALAGCLCLISLSCLASSAPPVEAPRNVILMIGDGMGPGQLELARRFAADGKLVMDRLDPSPRWMTTHNAGEG